MQQQPNVCRAIQWMESILMEISVSHVILLAQVAVVEGYQNVLPAPMEHFYLVAQHLLHVFLVRLDNLSHPLTTLVILHAILHFNHLMLPD